MLKSKGHTILKRLDLIPCFRRSEYTALKNQTEALLSRLAIYRYIFSKECTDIKNKAVDSSFNDVIKIVYCPRPLGHVTNHFYKGHQHHKVGRIKCDRKGLQWRGRGTSHQFRRFHKNDRCRFVCRLQWSGHKDISPKLLPVWQPFLLSDLFWFFVFIFRQSGLPAEAKNFILISNGFLDFLSKQSTSLKEAWLERDENQCHFF